MTKSKDSETAAVRLSSSSTAKSGIDKASEAIGKSADTKLSHTDGDGETNAEVLGDREDADVDGQDREDEHGEHDTDEGSSIALAAIVPLLLIAGLLAFALVLLFGRSRFDDGPAAVVVDPSERPEISPIEPEGDLEVTGPGILETFSDGDPTGLGETDNGRNWGELAGQWDISDGTAKLIRDPEVRALAAVDSGVINGTMLTTFVHARAGSGIVFRLVDARNYWMLVAVPNAATWNLRKVVNGVPTDVTNMGLASSDDGVTVSITFDGDIITLGLNGEAKATVKDNTHQGASTVGLTAVGATAGEVAWDNLIVTPLIASGG